MCLKYSFDLFDIRKIIATICPKNSTSITIAERIGMSLTSEYDTEYDGKLIKHLTYEIDRGKII